MQVAMTKLREALEASWDEQTAYLGAQEAGNPSLGQCYPTSRVLQHFFPKLEVAEGEVWTGKSLEKHFWTVLESDGARYHIDLTWQQFPPGSQVKNWKIRDRHTFNDGEQTIKRVELLLSRVQEYLGRK